ncbi:ATP-binding protein [Nonomuraea harbinensis]|uniref:ATP-binding protein n=1 Tax=Nonomuraea harbinensis TaxID=1286938 RepID=A0ABW1C7P0_9ACTN|nr:ATP-binding protein [Nonomuraea harbinensis]
MDRTTNLHTTTHPACRTFPGVTTQVREARRFVTSYLADRAGADIAALVISELATNAVRHSRSGAAGGTFGIAVHTRYDLVVLAVLDEGGPSVPRLHQAQDHELNGRGLHLVERLTTRWGVRGDGHGRTVWALLRLAPESQVTSARTTGHNRR